MSANLYADYFSACPRISGSLRGCCESGKSTFLTFANMRDFTNLIMDRNALTKGAVILAHDKQGFILTFDTLISS